MRPFPDIAQRQCGVFSAQQAIREGWTRSALEHAVRRERLRRMRRGAYQIADLADLSDPAQLSDPLRPVDLSRHEQARWRHAAPAIAAVLMTPGALASHSTAAVLHGLPLPFLPRRSCAAVVPRHTGEIRGVHLHRCTSTVPARWYGQVECHSAERTIVDLAREHGRLAGVMALDFALHTNLTSLAAMDAELVTARRWPGVRAAREAVLLADGRSESPLESHSRLTIRCHDLPVPRPQAVIGNTWGGFVARVDFYWDEYGVVGEADGDMKYAGIDPEPLVREKRRQVALERLGLQVVRWGQRDLRRFDAVADELRRAFARGVGPSSARRNWAVLPDSAGNFDPAAHAEPAAWRA